MNAACMYARVGYTESIHTVNQAVLFSIFAQWPVSVLEMSSKYTYLCFHALFVKQVEALQWSGSDLGHLSTFSWSSCRAAVYLFIYLFLCASHPDQAYDF